ncbi:MAG: PKD domain-containing protein [Candidatus Micrarchaeaceae archaeon]
MSGEFIAVENSFAGLSWGQFPNGTYWKDVIMVLPLNIAYGTYSNYVWFQFSIEFRSPTYPGPDGTILWNIQNNVYNGTMNYNFNYISLPYIVDHEYHFALVTSGSTATFSLIDRTTNDAWTKDFNIPSQNILFNPTDENGGIAFSPASCVEGVTTRGNSLTNVMFFQFRIFNNINSYSHLPGGTAPAGITTDQIQIGTSDGWYWMMLMPDKMPIPRLLEPNYPKAISLGETVIVDIFAINEGGPANWQTIAISFPEGQSVTDLSIIESDLTTGPPRIYNPGEMVNAVYSMSTVTLVNYLVEGSTVWVRNAQHHLKISFKPASTGSFIFYIKSVAGISDWACNWDPKSGNIDQQGEFVKKYTISVSERVIVSTHFSVYYNLTGPDGTTDEYAQAISYALEKSWMTLVVNFGFNSPPDSHIIVYLKDLPPQVLGRTIRYGDHITGWHVNYIEIDVGMDLGLARAIATREFFHAVLLSYDPDEAAWISEGMAKWAESRVYPEYAGSFSYVEYVNSYMNDPDRSLPQLSYEAVLFWIFVDQHYGISTLKSILQQTISRNGINAVDVALNTIGTSFVNVFKEWTIANYLKDIYYSNGHLFNPINATEFSYGGGRIDFERDVIDWGADYYIVTSSDIYMPMQFIGGSHHNLTKVLIEHGQLLISDFILFVPYAGSYWLMQANNLDKIVIIVRSLGTETSNDRTAYTLTFLSSSQTLTGPYLISSATLGLYIISNRGTQTTVQANLTIVSDSSYAISSPKTTTVTNDSSDRSSSVKQIYTINYTSSGTSSTKATTVTSDSSIIDSSSTLIEVKPIPPTASFIYRPPSPVVNQTVTFDATNSIPNGGTIISYQWDFGDNSSGEGIIVTHAYTSAGNYTVTLNVTDSEGAWNTTSKTITIYDSGILSVEIKNLMITDQNGNPKTNFNKGNIVQFNFTVENTGNIDLKNGLISVMILDPSNTPIFLSYTFESINPGDFEDLIIGFRIPLDEPAGLYTVKIMVFTDWPSQGGIGLDIETSTFNVT